MDSFIVVLIWNSCNSVVPKVIVAILDLLFRENSIKLRVAAVELLGKGFSLWGPCTPHDYT